MAFRRTRGEQFCYQRPDDGGSGADEGAPRAGGDAPAEYGLPGTGGSGAASGRDNGFWAAGGRRRNSELPGAGNTGP